MNYTHGQEKFIKEFQYKLYCATGFEMTMKLIVPWRHFSKFDYYVEIYLQWVVCAQTPQSPIQVDKVNLQLILTFTWFVSLCDTCRDTKRFPNRNYSVPLEISNGKNITENIHKGMHIQAQLHTHQPHRGGEVKFKHFIYAFNYT